MFDHTQDTVGGAVLKVAPPITVTTLKILGYPIADVAVVLTAIYTTLQIIFLIKDKILLPLLEKLKK